MFGTPSPNDNITVCIVALMIIQLNAFNMTLRKKRITGPRTTQAFYTTMLGAGFYLIFFRRLWHLPPTGILDPRLKFFFVSSMAYACRRLGMDKFLSWIAAISTVSLLHQRGGLSEGGEL